MRTLDDFGQEKREFANIVGEHSRPKWLLIPVPLITTQIGALYRSAFLSPTAYQFQMSQAATVNLSASERLTLRNVADGELHASEMDWVAVQRLKKMGLVEERGGSSMTTKEGQRVLYQISGLA